MGFRFQKRIKLFPGVTINLSKSGVSTSVGVRGARVNFGNDKTMTTLGLPGTGLSYRQQETDRSGSDGSLIKLMLLIVFLVIFFNLF